MRRVREMEICDLKWGGVNSNMILDCGEEIIMIR